MKGEGEEILLQLRMTYMKPLSKLSREPQPPVKERTKAQRTARVRYWRADGKITIREENGKKILYFEGRRMLRISEIKKPVADEFDWTGQKDQVQQSWCVH